MADVAPIGADKQSLTDEFKAKRHKERVAKIKDSERHAAERIVKRAQKIAEKNPNSYQPSRQDLEYLRLLIENPGLSDRQLSTAMGKNRLWASNRKREKPGFAEWVEEQLQEHFKRALARVDARVAKEAVEGSGPQYVRLYYQRYGLPQFVPASEESTKLSIELTQINNRVSVMSNEEMVRLVNEMTPALRDAVLARLRGGNASGALPGTGEVIDVGEVEENPAALKPSEIDTPEWQERGEAIENKNMAMRRFGAVYGRRAEGGSAD